VIAEDGVGAERCRELSEHGRPLGGVHVTRDDPHAGDVVTEQHDHVALEGVGCRDDAGDARGRHPGLAGMDITASRIGSMPTA
jgi:hypothetical protein